MTPSVFWAARRRRRVDGPDLHRGPQTLGLGLKFNYNKKYTLDLNYVSVTTNERLTIRLFDRDYYSARRQRDVLTGTRRRTR